MKQLQQYESQAHEHLRQGDDRAALSCFEQAFGTVVTSYCTQTQPMLNQGEWEAALRFLKEKIDLSSDAVTNDLRHLGQLLNTIGFLRHCLRDEQGAAEAHQLALMIHVELLQVVKTPSKNIVPCNLDSARNAYSAAS
jgi:hypothetical protein